MYYVRKLKLEATQQLDDLALAAGELYSRTVVSFWRVVRHKGIWLKPSSMMRWQNSDKLHAHSADAVVQSFYASLKSWRQRRKIDSNAKPPYRKRKYYRVQWKSSAIRLKDGNLILSNGRKNKPLVIPNWRWDCPKMVELGWNNGYELRATYIVETSQKPIGAKVAGIDLGEIHLAVAHDGESATILNGRLLRAKRQYQNKLKARLQSKLDKMQKGSRRWKKLMRSKRRQLTRLNNQINDILHKQTTAFVSTLHERGVQTLVIGDVRNLRNNVDYGHTANQRIHQMVTGRVRWMLTYKAMARGINVVLQDEKYTSQTCPACGRRHKPTNREFICECGFHCHRDAVGAFNIRQKYLGGSPVVGVMASPTGIRFSPNMRCSS